MQLGDLQPPGGLLAASFTAPPPASLVLLPSFSRPLPLSRSSSFFLSGSLSFLVLLPSFSRPPSPFSIFFILSPPPFSFFFLLSLALPLLSRTSSVFLSPSPPFSFFFFLSPPPFLPSRFASSFLSFLLPPFPPLFPNSPYPFPHHFPLVIIPLPFPFPLFLSFFTILPCLTIILTSPLLFLLPYPFIIPVSSPHHCNFLSSFSSPHSFILRVSPLLFLPLIIAISPLLVLPLIPSSFESLLFLLIIAISPLLFLPLIPSSFESLRFCFFSSSLQFPLFFFSPLSRHPSSLPSSLTSPPPPLRLPPFAFSRLLDIKQDQVSRCLALCRAHSEDQICADIFLLLLPPSRLLHRLSLPPSLPPIPPRLDFHFPPFFPARALVASSLPHPFNPLSPPPLFPPTPPPPPPSTPLPTLPPSIRLLLSPSLPPNATLTPPPPSPTPLPLLLPPSPLLDPYPAPSPPGNFLTTPIPTHAPPNFSVLEVRRAMYPAGPSSTQCVSNADCVFETFTLPLLHSLLPLPFILPPITHTLLLASPLPLLPPLHSPTLAPAPSLTLPHQRDPQLTSSDKHFITLSCPTLGN
ncbi:hypothetical protein C7M84_002722 [Penaeus vannamei]|uniref:Uncharacterized protein n=1 Tax=Penaeus vannamei TaxID=6689 RepID=A0A423TQ21_PENVA|nr:hypothetical protein C7M84_002722 [Penaeus vannamei]